MDDALYNNILAHAVMWASDEYVQQVYADISSVRSVYQYYDSVQLTYYTQYCTSHIYITSPGRYRPRPGVGRRRRTAAGWLE